MTNLSSPGLAWPLEAYTNDTLKGNFHFVQLSSKYANHRSAWHITCAKFKAAFCGKTFGKASHVSIVFSSTALLCKAKREKAAFFFFF